MIDKIMFTVLGFILGTYFGIILIAAIAVSGEEDKDAQQEPERQPEVRQGLEADQRQIREGASDV